MEQTETKNHRFVKWLVVVAMSALCLGTVAQVVNTQHQDTVAYAAKKKKKTTTTKKTTKKTTTQTTQDVDKQNMDGADDSGDSGGTDPFASIITNFSQSSSSQYKKIADGQTSPYNNGNDTSAGNAWGTLAAKNELFGLATKNTETTSYLTLFGNKSTKMGQAQAKAAGYGLALNYTGLDHSNSNGIGTDILNRVGRMFGGLIMMLGYFGNTAVSWIFKMIAKLLGYLNPLTWANSVPDNAGPFTVIANFVHKVYEAMAGLGFIGTTIAFAAALAAAVMGWRVTKYGQAQTTEGAGIFGAVVKMIGRMFIIIAFAPLLGGLFATTSKLVADQMKDQGDTASNYAVYSTFDDFQGWIEHSRLALPNGKMKALVASNDTKDFGVISHDDVVNINANGAGRSGAENLYNEEATTNKYISHQSTKKGDDQQDATAGAMLMNWMSGAQYQPSDWSSFVRSRYIAAANQKNAPNLEAILKKNPALYTNGSIDAPALYQPFTSYRAQYNLPAKYVNSSGKLQASAPGGLSTIGMYNYLSTVFTNSDMTWTSSTNLTNSISSPYHFSVGLVGRGLHAMASFLLSAALMYSIVAIGVIIGLVCFKSVAVGAASISFHIFKTALGSFKGALALLEAVFMVIIDLEGGVIFYVISEHLLMAITQVFDSFINGNSQNLVTTIAPHLSNTMTPGTAAAQASAIGDNTYALGNLVLAVILIYMTIMLIRMRGTLLKGFYQLVTSPFQSIFASLDQRMGGGATSRGANPLAGMGGNGANGRDGSNGNGGALQNLDGGNGANGKDGQSVGGQATAGGGARLGFNGKPGANGMRQAVGNKVAAAKAKNAAAGGAGLGWKATAAVGAGAAGAYVASRGGQALQRKTGAALAKGAMALGGTGEVGRGMVSRANARQAAQNAETGISGANPGNTTQTDRPRNANDFGNTDGVSDDALQNLIQAGQATPETNTQSAMQDNGANAGQSQLSQMENGQTNGEQPNAQTAQTNPQGEANGEIPEAAMAGVGAADAVEQAGQKATENGNETGQTQSENATAQGANDTNADTDSTNPEATQAQAETGQAVSANTDTNDAPTTGAQDTPANDTTAQNVDNQADTGMTSDDNNVDASDNTTPDNGVAESNDVPENGAVDNANATNNETAQNVATEAGVAAAAGAVVGGQTVNNEGATHQTDNGLNNTNQTSRETSNNNTTANANSQNHMNTNQTNATKGGSKVNGQAMGSQLHATPQGNHAGAISNNHNATTQNAQNMAQNNTQHAGANNQQVGGNTNQQQQHSTNQTNQGGQFTASQQSQHVANGAQSQNTNQSQTTQNQQGGQFSANQQSQTVQQGAQNNTSSLGGAQTTQNNNQQAGRPDVNNTNQTTNGGAMNATTQGSNVLASHQTNRGNVGGANVQNNSQPNVNNNTVATNGGGKAQAGVDRPTTGARPNVNAGGQAQTVGNTNANGLRPQTNATSQPTLAAHQTAQRQNSVPQNNNVGGQAQAAPQNQPRFSPQQLDTNIQNNTVQAVAADARVRQLSPTAPRQEVQQAKAQQQQAQNNLQISRQQAVQATSQQTVPSRFLSPAAKVGVRLGQRQAPNMGQVQSALQNVHNTYNQVQQAQTPEARQQAGQAYQQARQSAQQLGLHADAVNPNGNTQALQQVNSYYKDAVSGHHSLDNGKNWKPQS